MRRYLSLLAVAAAVGGMSALTAVPASALGSEALVCSISPGSGGTRPTCSTHVSSGSYTVTFQVNNSSSNETFAWTKPAAYPIVLGCTSTAIDCILRAPSGGDDQTISVSVVIRQGTASETLSGTAFIPNLV